MPRRAWRSCGVLRPRCTAGQEKIQQKRSHAPNAPKAENLRRGRRRGGRETWLTGLVGCYRTKPWRCHWDEVALRCLVRKWQPRRVSSGGRARCNADCVGGSDQMTRKFGNYPTGADGVLPGNGRNTITTSGKPARFRLFTRADSHSPGHGGLTKLCRWEKILETPTIWAFAFLKSGPVAQLGARFHGMEEVAGSIPARSTKFLNNLNGVSAHIRDVCVAVCRHNPPFWCLRQRAPLHCASLPSIRMWLYLSSIRLLTGAERLDPRRFLSSKELLLRTNGCREVSLSE